MHFDIKSPSTFITRVFTISTKDGKKKDIKLKVVYSEGKIYFTRRNKKSSWYKNLLSNDKAEFELGGKNLLESRSSSCLKKEAAVV